MIFAFTPFVVALWARQAERGTRAFDRRPRWRSAASASRSPISIMVAAACSAGGGKASWLWLLAYFVVITIGELYLSPIGLSLVTKVAPARVVSMMMGRLAGDELHRQFPRRLSRQLLERHGQADRSS